MNTKKEGKKETRYELLIQIFSRNNRQKRNYLIDWNLLMSKAFTSYHPIV